jgi:hypothetical protein
MRVHTLHIDTELKNENKGMTTRKLRDKLKN